MGTPHVIKKIQDHDTIAKGFKHKNKTSIDPKYFEPIIEGMHDVYRDGTASFLEIPDIEICGKTGTAENFKKINGSVKQLTDHSVFVAFAPKDNPKSPLLFLLKMDIGVRVGQEELPVL